MPRGHLPYCLTGGRGPFCTTRGVRSGHLPTERQSGSSCVVASMNIHRTASLTRGGSPPLVCHLGSDVLGAYLPNATFS